jgi:hypothetical protein
LKCWHGVTIKGRGTLFNAMPAISHYHRLCLFAIQNLYGVFRVAQLV